MKKILILFILFIIPINARAYTISRDDPIYVSGQSIGMKIDTPLTISGLYQIKDNGKTYRPWKNKLKENVKLYYIDFFKIPNSLNLLLYYFFYTFIFF